MANISSYAEYVLAMQSKRQSKEIEETKNNVAKSNGYENYEDYEYSVANTLSRDPRFSLSKVYKKKCDEYLISTIKAYILYLRNGQTYYIDREGNSHILTIFALNALTDAVLENNELVCNYIKSIHENPTTFIKNISETKLDAAKMFELRKRS